MSSGDTLKSESELMLMSLFLSAAHKKIGMAGFCLEQLNLAMRSNAGAEAIQFWIHSFLHHTAAISLIFWPVKRSSRDRGATLRAALDDPTMVDFLEKRTLRDHIAHMDERLEKWFSESRNNNHVGFVVGPRHTIGGNALDPGDIFEHLIPNEGMFVFRGDEFNLQLMADGLSRLGPELAKLSSYSWWSEEFKDRFRMP